MSDIAIPVHVRDRDEILGGGVMIGGSAVAEGARQLFGSLDATQQLVGAQSVEFLESHQLARGSGSLSVYSVNT
ncbi:hypothetical protein [Streptomyces sp. NPDC058155]|uniref:hypothetical protein n=1 Tax=Streptomyces sp. NPDC058155 TaxID=3346359 RepID=UPI0036E18318